tara:strand:+ start:4086 stop:4220 length:135 start_codon:yes stop_codon:yes gene_type:complete
VLRIFKQAFTPFLVPKSFADIGLELSLNINKKEEIEEYIEKNSF